MLAEDGFNFLYRYYSIFYTLWMIKFYLHTFNYINYIYKKEKTLDSQLIALSILFLVFFLFIINNDPLTLAFSILLTCFIFIKKDPLTLFSILFTYLFIYYIKNLAYCVKLIETCHSTYIWLLSCCHETQEQGNEETRSSSEHNIF